MYKWNVDYRMGYIHRTQGDGAVHDQKWTRGAREE